MAGNTRGRIKEHLEGIHKNLDWIKAHVIDTLDLIQDKNPKLTTAMKGIGEVSDQIDELIKGLYGKI